MGKTSNKFINVHIHLGVRKETQRARWLRPSLEGLGPYLEGLNNMRQIVELKDDGLEQSSLSWGIVESKNFL